jgi:hypothetical protein
VENPQKLGCILAELSLLCSENNKASPVPGNINDGILFLLSLNHDLWINILCKSCHSNIIFRLQTKAIRIINGITNRDSCTKHFKELKILTLKSQYIYSLSLFVINNRHNFETNSVNHNVNTRTKYDLHHPASQLHNRQLLKKGSAP